MAERRSKKRVEKTGKRYAQKDRRVPRKKEYGTRARTATQTSKGKGKFTWGDEMDDYYQYIDYEQQLLEDELAQQYAQEKEMEQALDEFASGSEAFYKELASYKTFIQGVITEFFDTGIEQDLLDAVAEHDDPRFNYELVKRLITMSLDRRNRERELVSQLLVTLHARKYITSEDIEDGFSGEIGRASCRERV